MRKNLFRLAVLAAMAVPFAGSAQQNQTDRETYLRPSYWRPYDQRGINVFETNKTPDSIPYDGLRIRFGAGFTQQFQKLSHSTKSGQALYQMGAGFDLAQANLFTDVQLADGIRLHLATYLSARHHNETWVKGGYIQFDKLPFKGQFWSDLMKITTVRIGHMEINYGDQHFRRVDGGQAMYNPFIENYIADAFSTEIGGEVTLQKNGVFGLVGVTNGTINASINKQGPDAEMDSTKNPALYFKAGIDKSLGNVRVRVTGSGYVNSKSQRNVLYGGDRTGSNYWAVMNPKGDDLVKNAFSGRFNPGFTRNIQAFMFNGFVKAGGLELFGTVEKAKGNAATATDLKKRNMSQNAIDVIYRFGASENLFAGVRYNNVKAEMPGLTDEIKIDRTAFAAGWFLTKNVLLKGEYVKQQYKNFAPTNILYGGKFNGYVIEAVVGF
ncbi:MAG TPA: hypothetical protein VL095_14700 [Flavisolibacter sp.]|nr:hypothetical protein [Flavisolibacter sp.]